jgi:hypothetical protein
MMSRPEGDDIVVFKETEHGEVSRITPREHGNDHSFTARMF